VLTILTNQAMGILNANSSDDGTSWRRVSELVDLAQIFDPDVQVCSWQRSIDPRIGTYLDGVAHHGTQQLLETLAPNERAKLDMLPMGDGREQLIDDLVMLTEILCELVDCPAVGFRGTRVEHAMCPKWHIDRVPIRMLCTYEGPGTEWLEDQEVSHNQLSAPSVAEGARQQAVVGEVVLLKGSLWQDNEGKGAIHRSPGLASGQGRRTLVSLDPLWLH